jgi:glycosyltransferase involved in cell wall biosynthesis
MKIALVSASATPLALLGDTAPAPQSAHVASLARAMGSKGHDVVVYARRADGGLPARVPLAPNVFVEHLDAPLPSAVEAGRETFGWLEAFGAGLKEALRRSPPDVIHSHMWTSAYAAISGRHGLRVPLVHTFHTLGAVRRRYASASDKSADKCADHCPVERLGIEESIPDLVDWIVATSRDEILELRRFGGRAEKMGVIPSGVDLDLFHPQDDAPRREGPPRVVVVSRLVQHRGVEDVVRAMATIPEAELVVAGGPPRADLWDDADARRLFRVAEHEGVAGRVRLLGHVERQQVPALLRSADVVACPAWHEPFGVVAVEAMACGVPVVGTRTGALLDAIIPDVTGLHVAPRDPSAMAAGLRALLFDPARRGAYGRAAALRAQAQYGWERIGAATLDVYQRVINRHRAPSIHPIPSAGSSAGTAQAEAR